MNPLQIIEQLGRRNPAENADWLEQLYRRKSSPKPRTLPPLERVDGRSAHASVGWLADRLEEVHRGEPPQLDPLSRADSRPDARYDMMRGLIARQRTRRTTAPRHTSSSFPSLQQELRLALDDQGHAIGRFELRNQLESTCEVRLEAGELRLVDHGSRVEAAVHVSPGRIQLAVDQSLRVRVEVILQSIPGGPVEGWIDVSSPDHLLAKLWLTCEPGMGSLRHE